MRRRDALASVAYQVVAAGAQLKAAAAYDRVRMGFIGSGLRGSQLLGDFVKSPGVVPVVVADLYDGCLQRAQEQTEGAIETTKDYRAVLDRKDIDAVVIATPDHWHKKMTLDALSAGKHVYIEKPLTWSIEEGPEIIAAAAQSKRLLQVGSGAKTSAVTAKARELVKSGVLGKIMQVKMVNNRNTPEGAWIYPIPPDASPKTIDWAKFLGDRPKKPFDAKTFFRWRCWWEYSGGVATDLFVHMTSQLHEVMSVEAPTSVVSQGGLFRWNDGRTVPDFMSSVYEYPGFLAEMSVNQCNGFAPRMMQIAGTEGTLEVGADRIVHNFEPKPDNVQRYGSISWPKEMRARYLETARKTAAPEKAKDIKIEQGPSHTDLFLVSLREGKPSVEDAREGHLAAGAAHLANMAFRNGRRMRWDIKTNTAT